MIRFDKPCLLVSGAVEYFREHMQLGDYLSVEGQVEMTWVGKGAEQLGIGGVCQLPDFEKLCRGQHPRDEGSLMVRDKGVHRRVCYFGQISAPKDVSLLYLVGGDRRIGQWWNEAVRETVTEIERATLTRVRRDGACEDRATGNFVATVVTHDASRALDPQLHTHLSIMNLTYDAVEQRWKGVQPSGFFRHQAYFREVCYNALAARLIQAGYDLEKARGIGFTVKGVPATLREGFSKRRRQILERAAATGTKSQDALHTIAGQTRSAKTAATERDLRARWIAEAGSELPQLQAVVQQALSKPTEARAIPALDAVRSAEAHVFERRSVVDERVLLREALIAGRGLVTLDGLKSSLLGREGQGSLIRKETEVASREGLENEKELIVWARQEFKSAPWGTLGSAEGLSSEQATAVERVLHSTGQVVIVQGDAGTGKTTCLKAIVSGIERSGGRVFACAPSTGAAEVLRSEVSTETATLQHLLINTDLQRANRGRVVLVDEAGLVSVRELRDLTRLATTHGYRLLLVGDTKQHSSVEAGDALRCLQMHTDTPRYRLTEIRRQKDPDYRRAVRLLARGEMSEALDAFDRLGAVKVIRETPKLMQAAAEDYVRTVQAGKTCLAISPVWKEIHAFNAEVRSHLKREGLLGKEERPFEPVYPLKWTNEERRQIDNYQPGDRLTFHRDDDVFRKHETVAVVGRDDEGLIVQTEENQNLRLDPRRVKHFEVGVARPAPIAVGETLQIRANLPAAKLTNGERVRVADFAPDGGLALEDGRTMPAWFRQFSHGYASTSHAAQGKTVDRGILIMAEAGIAAANEKQAYVSNSRFREDQVIYTTDLQAAREMMSRSGERKLVIEMDTSLQVAAGETPELNPSLSVGAKPGR